MARHDEVSSSTKPCMKSSYAKSFERDGPSDSSTQTASKKMNLYNETISQDNRGNITRPSDVTGFESDPLGSSKRYHKAENHKGDIMLRNRSGNAYGSILIPANRKLFNKNDSPEAENVTTYDKLRKEVPPLKQELDSQRFLTYPEALDESNSLSSQAARDKMATPLKIPSDGVKFMRFGLPIPKTKIVKPRSKIYEEKPELEKSGILHLTKSHTASGMEKNEPLRKGQTWPWQMSVQEQRRSGWHHICHGAIIHPKVILTTAECIYWKKLATLRVVKHKVIDNVTPMGDGSYVRARILHPNFSPNLKRYRLNPNDLSLLFLQKEMGVSPVTWNVPVHVTATHCMTSRNGRSVGIVPTRYCLYHNNGNYLVPESHMCAYGPSCDERSNRGSPLVCQQPDGTPFLIGLSTWHSLLTFIYRTVHIYLSIYLSIYGRNHVYLSIDLSMEEIISIYLSMEEIMSIYLSIYLWKKSYLSIYLSMEEIMSIYLSICFSVHAFLSVPFLSMYLNLFISYYI
ncbi:unnamed protein product [Acanthosepion pharaonis]|uniref:Peptidase S1 domain-containing protein n=1 Tax=Acanthosepion pharaonis TaxID=158019 RepID=A0A812DGP1_ACAPH|nr:unnamed protein product [Sepia pharaonis]